MRLDPEEIRLLRALGHRGIRQRAVARRLGVTEALVSMWASGKRRAGAARMAALRQLVLDTRDSTVKVGRAENDEHRADRRAGCAAGRAGLHRHGSQES